MVLEDCSSVFLLKNSTASITKPTRYSISQTEVGVHRQANLMSGFVFPHWSLALGSGQHCRLVTTQCSNQDKTLQGKQQQMQHKQVSSAAMTSLRSGQLCRLVTSQCINEYMRLEQKGSTNGQ